MNITCASCGAENRVPTARVVDGPKCGRCKAPLRVGEPIAAGSAADFDALVGRSKVPVVVDFWAAWCGPCRAVAPELEKLAAARAGQVLVVKLDTEAVPEVAARFGIRSIPTFVRFDGGRETTRTSGAMAAPALERALGL